MSDPESHETLAARLLQRVLDSGAVSRELREGALRSGGGQETDLPEACATLTGTIADASFRVSDEQVAAVRRDLGSDIAAFEVVMSASIGAGLRRWDAALRAIEEAGDAPA